MDRHNDKLIVAWYSADTGAPHHLVFDFYGYRPGTAIRAARSGEYDRLVEALKGQGCQVHAWSLEHWNRGYRENFYSGRYHHE